MQDEYQWAYERLVAGCRKCNVSAEGVLIFFDILTEKCQPAKESDCQSQQTEHTYSRKLCESFESYVT